MSNLKLLRESRNLSQSQLSELTGINKFQISKIERGVIKIGNISLTNAAALAKVLQIHAEDLLED